MVAGVALRGYRLFLLSRLSVTSDRRVNERVEITGWYEALTVVDQAVASMLSAQKRKVLP